MRKAFCVFQRLGKVTPHSNINNIPYLIYANSNWHHSAPETGTDLPDEDVNQQNHAMATKSPHLAVAPRTLLRPLSDSGGLSSEFDDLTEDEEIHNCGAASSPRCNQARLNWRKLQSALALSRLSKNNWIQLAGHAGSFYRVAAGRICKAASSLERAALPQLMNDALKPFVPEYYEEVLIDEKLYVQMQDLLYGFRGPCVMDVKVGFRTFSESDVVDGKRRPDLLEKMAKLDPSSVTEEDTQAGGITKLRYMMFRERMSSTSDLGFRIEGIKAGEYDVSGKKIRTREQIEAAFRNYTAQRPEVGREFALKLKELRETLAQSEFFRTHEIVGSSLLFVYDGAKCGLWMIDFGKSKPLPEGVENGHLKQWVMGNHADGYLLGLDNLVTTFDSIL